MQGKYKLTAIDDKAMGGEVNESQLEEMGMSMCLEFFAGNTCTLSMGENAAECAVRLEGKTLAITGPEGLEFVGAVDIDGNRIVIENEAEMIQDGNIESYMQKMIFEKE